MWPRYDGLDQRARCWITLVGVCEAGAETPIRSHIHAAMARGKAALVTGAGGGLGQATAVALAQAGADVCIVDLKAEGRPETARRIEALGRRALVRVADLSEAENCAPLRKRAMASPSPVIQPS